MSLECLETLEILEAPFLMMALGAAAGLFFRQKFGPRAETLFSGAAALRGRPCGGGSAGAALRGLPCGGPAGAGGLRGGPLSVVHVWILSGPCETSFRWFD